MCKHTVFLGLLTIIILASHCIVCLINLVIAIVLLLRLLQIMELVLEGNAHVSDLNLLGILSHHNDAVAAAILWTAASTVFGVCTALSH